MEKPLMRSRLIILVALLLTLAVTGQVLLAAPADTVQKEQRPTPTLDPFPRPDDYEIIVAEQVFQNGRMFYLDPNKRIWVLLNDDDGASGTWQVFEDTWNEGEPELDASIRPPDGMHQPIRGFGELWRQNDDVRLRLGWALDPEIGHRTTYSFVSSEEADAEVTEEADEAAGGDEVVAPGVHTLVSWYGQQFIFNEADMTWTVDVEGNLFTPLEDVPEEIEAEDESS
jgi:hypothetical protein